MKMCIQADLDTTVRLRGIETIALLVDGDGEEQDHMDPRAAGSAGGSKERRTWCRPCVAVRVIWPGLVMKTFGLVWVFF